LIQYKGEIDVIYIDPPYGKDKMGEFAETNYDNAITRDNLLSMLYPRLVLAKQLLSDNGVIFCSIDDKNQAYVKGLFDEVFGESNFVGTYFWKKTETPPSLSHKIRKKLEYVLCYQSTDIPQRKFAQGLIDGDDAPLLNSGNPVGKLVFPAGSVKFNIADGIYEHNDKYKIELLKSIEVKNGINITPVEASGNFKWAQDTLEKEVIKGTYFLIKSQKFSIRYQKPEEITSVSTKVPSNIIDMEEVSVGTNETAAKELAELGFGGDFDYAKPTSLIAYLIKMGFWKENSIKILDFFSGSGTTGQAVLELNKDDEGNRQFILVTNNEKTDTTPNGIAVDVTSKRLKRVMTGKCYDGTSDFEWAKNNKPRGDNLEVLEIAEVPNFEHLEGKTPFDVIDETLYGKNKLSVKEKVEWVCDNFEITQKKLTENE